MIGLAAAAWLFASTVSTSSATEILVCGRTMRVEDLYCAAITERRPWGHRDAAKAYERFAAYALPDRVADAYAAAANNWMAAHEPDKALVDFDRALTAPMSSARRKELTLARARAAEAARRR